MAGCSCVKEILEEILPKFFFDLDDGSETRDRIGSFFEDLLEAKTEALTLGAIYAAKPVGLKDGWALQISVRDENDDVVMRLRMACQVDLLVR